MDYLLLVVKKDLELLKVENDG